MARVTFVVMTGGKATRDGDKTRPSGIAGCIASVVFNGDYSLNWTVSSKLGSVAVNVTECSSL